MSLTITLRAADCTPIDLRGVTPDVVQGDPLDRLQQRQVRCGNRRARWCELFDTTGSPADAAWQLTGDWSCVHGVAAGMTAGCVQAAGAVGRQAGAGMAGGSLHIGGNAGDELGVELRGGQIVVAGSVGDNAGGTRPGSRHGQRGGTILIEGNAGAWLGRRMRRGLIAVAGDAGPGAAAEMHAGTILLWGHAAVGVGADMVRGTVGLLEPRAAGLLTFTTAAPAHLPATALLNQELARLGFSRRLPDARELALSHGDLLRGGRGEAWLRGATPKITAGV